MSSELEALKALWEVAVTSPFLICILVPLVLVFIVKKILKIHKPHIEKNRWFKTFLPIGILVFDALLAFGLSFAPMFDMHWLIAVVTGVVAGGVLIGGYESFYKNIIRQHAIEEGE